ncbi:hypothetical protein [Naasia sp. SYSU D00057]|uniref:hypothetical protein n=1 Tax=Naasia sp. SYSU D00057 TaxID=2817380 RepID=UPI001B307C80|nr:hypothetical protein [Naasia sp. SYSU D00057]
MPGNASGSEEKRRTRPAPLRRRLRRAVAALLLPLTLGACTDSGPGPSVPTGTTTLRMAHVDPDPGTDVPARWFLRTVDGLSEGTLQVEFEGSCCGEGADAERRLIERVADGDYDLGWVGTHAFAGAATEALAPLSAPFLIDSYTLQQAALQSPIAGRMAAAVADAGVIGIALQPGMLLRPIASDAPLRTPADWRGMRVQMPPSEHHALAAESLGAEAVRLGPADLERALADRDVRAVVDSLPAQAGAAAVPESRIVLEHVIGARMSVLIAAPDAVSPVHGEVLRRAAAFIVSRTRQLASVEADAVARICAAGGRFAEAEAADLEALRFATRSVSEAIGRAEPAPAQLGALQELKTVTAPEDPPPVPDGCRD